MNVQGKYWLIFGGLCSFAIAILHIGIIIIGTPAYRFFGAGEEMAQMSSSGSALPALITLFIAFIFTIWGLYTFSGAALIRHLPLLRLGLFVIASIYSLRGIVVVPQVVWMIKSPNLVSLKGIIFSLISLLIGIVYFVGLISVRRELKVDSYGTNREAKSSRAKTIIS